MDIRTENRNSFGTLSMIVSKCQYCEMHNFAPYYVCPRCNQTYSMRRPLVHNACYFGMNSRVVLHLSRGDYCKCQYCGRYCKNSLQCSHCCYVHRPKILSVRRTRNFSRFIRILTTRVSFYADIDNEVNT